MQPSSTCSITHFKCVISENIKVLKSRIYRQNDFLSSCAATDRANSILTELNDNGTLLAATEKSGYVSYTGQTSLLPLLPA